MAAFHHEKPSKVRRWAWVTAQAAAISVVLGVTTVLLGPLAATGIVCVVLWVALFRNMREQRRQEQTMEGYLDAVRDKYDSIIGVLCGAMNLRDDIKSFHTSRVSTLAEMVAVEMGLRHDEIRLLQKSAVLADIGKVEIAESILTKPGELSGKEWEQMKRHPELGFKILTGITHLRDAGDTVLAHHERFDGQGYPHGLRGEEIPAAARILAVADAYTAMTSDRPHRKRMTHEMAVKEILRNSLTQFDPEVVRAFVRCDEQGKVVGTSSEPEPAELPAFEIAAISAVADAAAG
jgi:HD-GYP domain-containing protein (c-di-GMP phosphodiesterase class II)